MSAEPWFVSRLHHLEPLGLVACDRCGVMHDASTTWIGTIVRGPQALSFLLCSACVRDQDTAGWSRRRVRHRPIPGAA